MSPRHLPFATAALLFSTGAMAAEEDRQMWINVTVQGRLGSKGLYFVEAQPRFGAKAAGPEQLLLRPAVGVQLSRRITLHQGYAHVVTYARRSATREERSFQQLGWMLAQDGRGDLSSRTRLEQRWRADAPGVGVRLRHMVRAERAFAPSGKGVRALGSVEAFVALNDTRWGARAGFDQVRSFTGVELPLAGRSTVEVGYLNQAIDRRAAGWRVNHVAAINLFVRH